MLSLISQNITTIASFIRQGYKQAFMRWIKEKDIKPPEPGDVKVFWTADTDEPELPLELKPIIFYVKKDVLKYQMLKAEDISIYPMDYISESEQESLK